MKATSSGMTVGIALEPYDGSTGTSCPQGSLSTSSGTTLCSKILVFVNLGYSKLDDSILGSRTSEGTPTSDGWSVDQTTGRIKASYALDMDNKDILNVRKMLSASGLWSIDEFGKLVVQEIEAKKITTQELKVQNPVAAKTGITIVDRATGAPVCVV